jgi:hypothetical protein
MGLESMQILLAPIHLMGHTAAYLLLEAAYCLAAVIELTARDEVRYGIAAFFQPGLKQPVLTVDFLRLSSHAQSYDFQVRETGN